MTVFDKINRAWTKLVEAHLTLFDVYKEARKDELPDII